MDVHERYEERKLYPYLERRYGVSLAWLREEHDELALLDELVRDAFGRAERAAEDAIDAAAGEVASALEAHRTVLEAHLRAEEDAVVPMLLALDAETFAQYRAELPSAPWPRPRMF